MLKSDDEEEILAALSEEETINPKEFKETYSYKI